MSRVAFQWCHMSILASQITSNMTVCSIACSGQQGRKIKAPPFVKGIQQLSMDSSNGGFPTQRVSAVESVSMSWHHHVRTSIMPKQVFNQATKPPFYSDFMVTYNLHQPRADVQHNKSHSNLPHSQVAHLFITQCSTPYNISSRHQISWVFLRAFIEYISLNHYEQYGLIMNTRIFISVCEYIDITWIYDAAITWVHFLYNRPFVRSIPSKWTSDVQIFSMLAWTSCWRKYKNSEMSVIWEQEYIHFLLCSCSRGLIQGNDKVAPVRAAQFSFRPGDNLPLHFGLNFRYPFYIYIRACCIIYICSLYHSVHKFTINNPNLCIIGQVIFNWKYWFDNLSGHLLRPSED